MDNLFLYTNRQESSMNEMQKDGNKDEKLVRGNEISEDKLKRRVPNMIVKRKYAISKEMTDEKISKLFNKEYSMFVLLSNFQSGLKIDSFEKLFEKNKNIEYSIKFQEEIGISMEEFINKKLPFEFDLFYSMVQSLSLLEENRIVLQHINPSIFNFIEEDNKMKIVDLSSAKYLNRKEHNNYLFDEDLFLSALIMDNQKDISNLLFKNSFTFAILVLLLFGSIDYS